MPPAAPTARGRFVSALILDGALVVAANVALPSSHLSISGTGMIRMLPRRTIRSSGWTCLLNDDSLMPTAFAASPTVNPRRGGDGRSGIGLLSDLMIERPAKIVGAGRIAGKLARAGWASGVQA